jgi:hypothetical protein
MIGMIKIVIFGIIIYVVGSYLKMVRLNKDINQKQMAGLLSGVGRGELEPLDIIAFLSLHGWEEKEAVKRICHALTLTQNICTASEYRKAHEIGMEICRNYVQILNSFKSRLMFESLNLHAGAAE